LPARAPSLDELADFDLRFVPAFAAVCSALLPSKGQEKGNVSRDPPEVIRPAETPACAHTENLSILAPMTSGQNLQLA
jgi:hypothetical protein